MTSYGVRVTPPQDEAAVAAGKAAALAGMEKIDRGLRLAAEGRDERDAGITKMRDAGGTLASITRDLGIPKSTVRQSLLTAAARSARS